MTTSNRTHTTGNARRSAGTPRMRRGRMGVAISEGELNYKDASQMRRIINERGKIESTRRTGAHAKLQRQMATAIKRARHLALIPMAPHHNQITEVIQDASQRTQVVASSSAGESQDGASEPPRPEASAEAANTDAKSADGEGTTDAPAAESSANTQEAS